MSETVTNAPIAPSGGGNQASVASARNVVSVPAVLNKDVAAAATLTIRVFYQGPDGGIFERKWGGNGWNDASGPLWYALPCTPLAAVTWDSGQQTRVYYLDRDCKLQEYAQVPGGAWQLGGIGKLDVQAAPGASIAAVHMEAAGKVSLRVYCQEAGSDNIQEFSFGDTGHGWLRGAKLVATAIDGTAIAATLSA